MTAHACPWFHVREGMCMEYVSEKPVTPTDAKCDRCGKYMVIVDGEQVVQHPDGVFRELHALWRKWNGYEA